MAKEKLLFFIIALLVFVNPIFAQKPIDLKANDQESNLEFSNLLDISKQSSLQKIKEKWLELQIMLGKENGTSNNPSANQAFNIDSISKENLEDIKSSTQFWIFVSSSMNKNLLKT